MKVMHIVGARPNFMKVAPIMAEMARYPEHFLQTLVHTGQHYDFNMSDIFFHELGMPAPDEFLGVGSGSHAEQTARVMMAFEPIVLKYRPDWVIVVGDVNSTLACALVCVKLGIRVAHVEAGLRSGDRTMPEEINRILTDQISDLLFTPSMDGNENLLREGIISNKIHFVGNVMIDTLIKMLPLAKAQATLERLNLKSQSYILVTLHRPSNVDELSNLITILDALKNLAGVYPVVFPVHPRTKQKIAQTLFVLENSDITFIEPQGYLDFLVLTQNASIVLTDSGGIQEETSYLKVPCLTLRPNTERPVTIKFGTNSLIATTKNAIYDAVQERLQNSYQRDNQSIPFWDGCAAKRIVAHFLTLSVNYKY